MEPAEAARGPALAAASVLLGAFLFTIAVDWPKLPYGARLPEVFFAAAAPAACIAWGLRLPRWRLLDTLVVGYLMGSVPAVAAAHDAAAATEWVRHVYLAAVYWVLAAAVADRRAILVRDSLVWGAFALATAGLAFVAIDLILPLGIPLLGERMSIPYLGGVLRLRGLTASPAMLACLMMVAIPLALVPARADERQSTRWRLVPFACIAAAVLTFSHALAGVVIAILMAEWPRLKTAGLRTMAVAGAIALVLVFNLALIASIRAVHGSGIDVGDSSAFHHAVGSGRLQVGSWTVDYDVMSYARLKQLAWDAFLDHPLTGIGLDRFHQVTEAAYQQGRLPSLYRAIDPHSTLLGRLAETGIVGGATLVGLWGGVVALGWSLLRGARSHKGLARAATAGILALLVSSINVDIMNFRFLWAALGMLRGLAELADEPESAQWNGRTPGSLPVEAPVAAT